LIWRQVLKGCRATGSSIENYWWILVTIMVRQTAERLRNAADMGNITELKAIAAALRSDSNAYGDFSETINRLAEDFDLEGIIKLSDKLREQIDK